MPDLDPDRLLVMLRDPNVESREVASAAGVAREDAARAARLVASIARAAPEEALLLPPPLAAAVARAALGAGRADLLTTLASHPAKEVIKEAKRCLHVLKARGVAVPELPKPQAPAPATQPEPPPPCYATPIDARGERAIWIPKTVPGKGIEIAQAVTSDEEGLIELQVGLLGRKEFRSLMQGLVERGAAMGVGEIERGLALSLVVEARALNDRTQKRVPEGADLWLAQAGRASPASEPAAPPPLPEAEEHEALAASGALHDLPLFASWLAEEPFLRELAAKLDEVSVSPLYVDERQRTEQLVRTLADAVESYFEGGRRTLASRRLLALAAHLAARGDEVHARSAAAAGRALAASGAARSIPFARRMIERAFPTVAAMAGPPPEDPSGSPLVIAPR